MSPWNRPSFSARLFGVLLALAALVPTAAAASDEPPGEAAVAAGSVNDAERGSGGTSTLLVGSRAEGRTFLRFAPISTPGIRLHLFVLRGSGTLRIRSVEGTWSERSLAEGRTPRLGPGLATVRPEGPGWTSVDLATPLFRRGTIDLALTPGRRTRLRIAGRKSSKPPKIEPVPAPPPVTAAPSTRVFAYYYTWWSRQHWQDKLGSAYPLAQSPLPLPADLDAAGCNATSRYPGNQLTDVPASLYSQDDPGVIETHVRQAAAAGLSGFIANWRGNGLTGQTPTNSTTYSARLEELVRAVSEVRAEGRPFSLWIQYKASSEILPLQHILNDLDYLSSRYGINAAFDRHDSPKLTVVWGGSRKYPLDVIRTVGQQFRDRLSLIGDENWNTWGDGRAQYLDGDQYYWSSQNPYTNPSSFEQLRNLAGMVRASGPNPDGSAKRWYAPMTPGYNSELLGSGSCVPRNGTETMQRLYEGNKSSNPDGWVFISWNEIAEGTYVEPLQRYGSTYLDALGALIKSPA